MCEELGVEHVVLERVGIVTRAQLDIAELGIRDYELQQSFRGVFDGALQPNRDEIAEVGAFDLAALSAAFAARPEDFTPWFRRSAIALGLCAAAR
jgi:isopentenyldiphosphate isomerase